MQGTTNAKAERLSWAEIKARYPDQHVALIDVQQDSRGEVESAIVAVHHEDKKTFYRLQAHLSSASLRWTGESLRWRTWGFP